MENITSYTDYRKFLKDYYDAARKRNPGFSYQVFSQHAGISSRGFLYNVVSGKRRLSSSHVEGVARAMKLSKGESEYFEHLVAYENARSLEEKKRHFERMVSVNISGKSATEPYLVRKEQYRYYSQWYHAVIRSIVDLHGFSGDFETLAKSVHPPITASQAKKSVELLLHLGFIKKNEDATYSLVDKLITSAPEVISMAIHNYHQQTLDLAKKAINDLPRDRRNFTGVTLGVSLSGYRQICKELEMFRMKLMDIAERDQHGTDPQGVYHLNLQLFAVSQPLVSRKTIDK